MKTRLLILMTFLTFSILSSYGKYQAEIERLSFLADSLYSVGKVDSALTVGHKLVELAEKEKEPSVLTSCYTSLGVYLRSSGKLEEAVAAYDKAINYSKQLSLDSEENLQSIVVMYNNLSTLYLDMKSHDKAEEYALQAVNYADKCEDKLFRSQIYSVASSIFIIREKYDMAMQYLKKAKELSEEMQQHDAALNAMSYYVLAMYRTGKPQQQINEAIKEAEEIVPLVKSKMSLISYYQTLFYVYQHNKSNKKTIETAQKLLAIEEIESYPFILYDIYNNLHAVYREEGDYKKAYTVLEKAKVLQDSLFVNEKGKQLEELSVKYETQKKELEIQKLNEQQLETRHRTQMLVGGLLLLLLVVAIGAVYIVLRQRLRIEQQKRETERQKHQFEQIQHETQQTMTKKYLKQLEEEHERLAKELHDGICNDLLALEMQIDKGSVSDAWIENLKRSREQIRQVSHELLPPIFQEATIFEVLSHYAKTLSTSDLSIKLSTNTEDIDWSVLPDHLALNIYRIVQEATGNAMKHSSATLIEIGLNWQLPDLVITIADNGHNSKFDRTGVGLRTMQERAAAMKGKLEVDFSPEGCRIIVSIPVFA